MYQLLLVLAITALVALDQLTKFWAVRFLSGGETVSLWDGVLELCYSENTGIAWGLLQDRRWLVVVATGLMLTFLLVVLLSGRFRTSKLVSLGGVLMLAGGVGNLVDRLLLGYVVDFIHYYKWFDFPIFNVADCCVTVGAVLILVYFFFFGSKEKEPAKEAVADGAASADADRTTDGNAP